MHWFESNASYVDTIRSHLGWIPSPITIYPIPWSVPGMRRKDIRKRLSAFICIVRVRWVAFLDRSTRFITHIERACRASNARALPDATHNVYSLDDRACIQTDRRINASGCVPSWHRLEFRRSSDRKEKKRTFSRHSPFRGWLVRADPRKR